MPRIGLRSEVDPNRWIREHGDAMFRFAMRRVKRTDVAEDLVQETFVAALRNRERFAGNASERTWLISILKRKVIDYHRTAGREQPASRSAGEDHWLESHFDKRERWVKPPRDWGTKPESALERSEFWQVFEDCLSKLPVRLAKVFYLKTVEEESSEFVCKVFHITPNNLWVMLHRARMRLWHCLSVNWFEETDE